MTRFVATVVDISRSTAGPTRTSVREWDLSPGAARLGYRISDQPSQMKIRPAPAKLEIAAKTRPQTVRRWGGSRPPDVD